MRRTAAQAAELSLRLGGPRLPAAGMGHVASAEVWYEWNDLAGALHAATQGIALLRGTVERLLLVRGYIVLAQVYQAQGAYAAALDSIQRCAEWFAQTPIVATGAARAWLAAYQARLWVRQGDLGAAGGWAQACRGAGERELDYVQQLTLVRLRLAQGPNDTGGQWLGAARTMLAQVLPAAEARGWTRYLIEGLVLQALVCQAQADRASAVSALERALTLAQPEGYVRIFVDEGAPQAELLAQTARGEAPVAGYAAKLLEAFPETINDERKTMQDELASHRSSFSVQPLVEPLSDREIEILDLIAAGCSNQAIADTLVIALSTVKKHINNIYGKLDVQSRTQALVRAREINLL
jgi:LuxR family maltose regulon positive regulatory protein